LRKDKIPPLARLIAVADKVAYETLGLHAQNRVGIHNAIRKIVAEPREDLDPYFMAHFMRAASYTLPAAYQRYVRKKEGR
jgi:response regulator RpfG family c-di-GMP phosphodiesterase